MVKITLLYSILLLVIINSYTGVRVYRIQSSSEDELRQIKLLTDSTDYDVWTPIRGDVEYVDVMVDPKQQEKFSQTLEGAGINYNTLIEDVGTTIQEQVSQTLLAVPNDEINFSDYQSYGQIQAYLRKLAQTHPHVSLENIGKSYEGRDLEVVKISSKSSSGEKPIIFIEGGIHAREWISPAAVLYIVQQLAENPDVAKLRENVDWHILPILNPDGYSYTFQGGLKRLWRKTRSINANTSCIGVDGNRNFGFQWGVVGSGTQPCGEMYRGETPFSEPETLALRNYILKIKDHVKLYLAFHSYGNKILYPWTYTTELPENADELQSLGAAVAKRVREFSGTVYSVGTSPNILYTSSGTSKDWLMGEAGVKLPYTIELPGMIWGYVLPPRYILGVVTEIWEGVLIFHEYIEAKYAVTDNKTI